MICEAISKEKQIMYLYYERHRTLRHWTCLTTIVLLSCLVLSIVTDCSLFMLISAAISFWSLLRNRMTREFLEWVESFADGWATAHLQDRYVYITSRNQSYAFIPVVDEDAEPDMVRVDFINRAVYMTQVTFDALYTGSIENAAGRRKS